MGFFKGLLKTVTGIIAVVLCVVIFTLELGLHLVIDTKNYLTERNIKNVVSKINLDILLEDDNGQKTELAENLYSSFGELSNKTVDKIIESKSVRKLIGTYLGSSIESFLYDKPIKKPTVDEIIEVIEDNFSIIEEAAKEEGLIFTETDKDELISQIRNSDLSEVLEELPDLSEELKSEDNEFTEILDITKQIYDIKAILLILVAIIVLVLIIALIRFSLHSWMMWLAIPTMISGIVVLILTVAGRFALNLIEIDASVLEFITNNILPNLILNLVISGIIAIAISIGLIILYSKINKSKKQQLIINN